MCVAGTWAPYGDEPLCWACAGREAASGTPMPDLVKPAVNTVVDPVNRTADPKVKAGNSDNVQVNLGANWVNLDKNSDKNDKKAGITLGRLLNLDLDADWLAYATAAGLDEAVVNAGFEALRKGEG